MADKTDDTGNTGDAALPAPSAGSVLTDEDEWLADARRHQHTQLDRIQASAQVWVSVLTTLIGLAGSVVLIKGNTLLTGLTSSPVFLWLAIALIVATFAFALLALITGAAATWGGLSAVGDGSSGTGSSGGYRGNGTAPAEETRVFGPLLFFAFDREPLPQAPQSSTSTPEGWGARYRALYRETAISRRNLLHASRTLGIITIGLIAVLAVVLLVAGVVAPATTNVIVVHGGRVTCEPVSSAQSATEATQVIVVSQC